MAAVGEFALCGSESLTKSPKFREEMQQFSSSIPERNIESEDSKLELGRDPPLYLFDQDIRIADTCA